MAMEFENQTNLEDERLVNGDFLMDLKEFMDDAQIKDLNIGDTATFKIVSRDQANYFVKKIMEIRSEKDNINHVADLEISNNATKVNAWREKEMNKRQNDEEYITNLLKNFAEEELVNSKAKSISLPHGSIGFRKQGDKYEYDDAALLAFLQDDKGLEEKYVKFKPSPDKTTLKKDGEVKNGVLYIGDVAVAGVTVTPQDPKFEIK